MTKHISHTLLVSLASLGLYACAGGGSDPESLRTAEAVTPSEAPEALAEAEATNSAPATTADAAEGTTVSAMAAPAVAQWRPWMESEVERLRTARPDYFDAVMSLPARTTRAGFPRLTGPLLREPDAAPILLYRLLSKNESVEVRAAIVEALPRTTGDYSAALAELMSLETEPRVRELIVASLWRAQAPYALDGLALGVADVDARVRAESIRTLARRPDGVQMAAAMITALSDPEDAVRIEAVRALGVLKVADAKPGLVALLSSGSADVRRHSLRAIDRIDPAYARSLPQLESLRSDPDPKVARVAETIASRG